MSTLTNRFRGEVAAVKAARKAVIAFARSAGFSDGQLDEIELATGEALANAVEHGTQADGVITLRCEHDGAELMVEIHDSGAGFDHQRAVVPNEHSTRGFGRTIMRSTMDDMCYLEHGRTVRLFKRGPIR